VRKTRQAHWAGPVTTDVALRRFHAASPVMAVLLGVLGLALIAACVFPTYLTGDLEPSRDGPLR